MAKETFDPKILQKMLGGMDSRLKAIEQNTSLAAAATKSSGEERLESARAEKIKAKNVEKQTVFLKQMAEGIKGLGESMKKMADSMKQKTKAGIGILIAGLMAPIVTIVSFFKQLSAEFAFLKKLTGGGLKKIFKPLKTFFNSEKGIGKFFSDFGKKINPKNWKWVQSIQTFFTESKAFQKFGKMWQGLKGGFTKFGTIIGKIFKPIAGMFESIFSIGKTLIAGSETATKIMKWAGKFGSFLGKIFLPITIVMSAFDFITGFMEGYKEEGIIGGLEGGLTKLFKGLIGMPLDLLTKGISWIFEKFGWTNLSKSLDSFTEGGGFSGLIDKFIGGFFDVVKNVVGWIKDLFTDPVGTLKELWDKTLDGAASIGKWIGDNVLTKITKFFVDTFTWTGDTLKKFDIMQRAKDMWNDITEFFGKAFDFVMPDWDMGETFKSAIKILAKGVPDFLIPDSVLDWLGEKKEKPKPPTKPTTAQTGADIVQSDEVAHQKYQEAQAKSGHGAATGGAKTAIASGDKDTMKAEIDAIYNSAGNKKFTAEQKSNLNALNVALGRAPAVSKVSGRESEKADNNLTGGDKAKLKDALGKRESGGKYNTLNSLGFSGKYQFGHMALEDMGLLKSGASKLGTVAKVTSDSSNWTIKGGLSTWLSNGGLQEKSMDKLMSQNLRVLKGAPGFKDFDKANVAGALAAAHLVGAGGAKKFLAGTDSKDAYGTKASDYFELGRNAIAAAKGFSGVVKQPTVFLTGEAGPEMVNVTPLHDPSQKSQAMNQLQTANAEARMGGRNGTTVVAPTITKVNNSSSQGLIMPARAQDTRWDRNTTVG